MLCAHALTKRFGAKTLFSSLAWQIGRGERIGLVGDNGAGKTTLLRILAGEIEADEGSVSRSQGETLAYLPQEMPRTTAGTIRERVATGDAGLLEQERTLHDLTHQLTNATADAAADLAGLLADAQVAFSQAGGDRFAGRVEQILLGLGFARERFDAPVASLSGGWAMRVELARLLVAEPNYLLMDEPTNHLDAQSLAWLENFMQSYSGSWIVISHDHAFLDRTVSSVAALAFGELLRVRGTYSDYQEYLDAFAEQEAHAETKRAQKAQHLQAFIDRFGAKASKAKQAKSKAKALEKLTVSAPAKPKSTSSIHFRMRVADPGAQAAVRAEGLTFGYGARDLLKNAELQIERGDKIAIVGRNGAGKSTLLRLLGKHLTPTAGSVTHGARVCAYMFGQHQSEALDPTATVYQSLSTVMPNAPVTAVRSLLAAFLFDAHAMDRRVQHLSGGEKNRLALAKMVASPANLLLLDEPTNHLDAKSRDVLAEALATYNGTLILVSHEHDLCERLAQRFITLDGSGRLRESFSLATALARDAAAKAPAAPSVAPASAPTLATGSGKDTFRAQKQARARERERSKRVERLEGDIKKAEDRLAAIDAALLDKATFDDGARASELLRERRALADGSLPALMAEWEAAAAGCATDS